MSIKKFQIDGGYTLIEILIVVSLIGLAVGLITTSYLGFERRQRLKNAVQEVKSNIRLAQNNAQTGNKGFGSDKCDTDKGDILLGWFASIDTGSPQTYSVVGYCKYKSVGNKEFGGHTFHLPGDVSISSINAGSRVYVLYRPLTESATFHTSADFFNSSGGLQNEIFPAQIIIDLSGPTPYKYQVIILPTGEVNEKQL